jgi:hypothetical protein
MSELVARIPGQFVANLPAPLSPVGRVPIDVQATADLPAPITPIGQVPSDVLARVLAALRGDTTGAPRCRSTAPPGIGGYAPRTVSKPSQGDVR